MKGQINKIRIYMKVYYMGKEVRPKQNLILMWP